MKLFMIAKSNIKKNKSMSITLIVLILFASILLYIGTSVLLNLNTFLEDKNKELNGSDFTILTPVKYDESVTKVVQEMGELTQLEKVPAILSSSTFQNLTIKEKSQSIGCLFMNADKAEEIAELKILDKGEEVLQNSIILPYYLKVANGYHTGDEITITYSGKKHTFIVYGFAEDIMFATPSNISYYKCYVFGDEFQKLFEEDEFTQYSLMKTKLEIGSDAALFSDQFIKNINNEIKGATSSIITMDIDSIMVGVGIFLIIIMCVLIAFSAIIILISLTVMRFAIVTYIEGNMKNIGSMEALGYTAKELIIGTVLQFMLLALTGIGIGLVAAFSGTGIITNIVSSSIGLVWDSRISPLAIVINIVFILAAVIIITLLTALKLNKITPIIALREGINTHNFKKNHFPLTKSSLNVNAAVGMKTLMQNMKQNVMILIIATLMSFVCVLAFTSNYNFNIDNTALLKLIGMEKSDLMVTYNEEDAMKIFDHIASMDHVVKTLRISMITLTVRIGDREMTPNVAVSNDFSQLEIKTIVKGRYPVHDNEIAITGLVMERLKAKLGDVITIQNNDSKQDFIIVGETQQINNLGKGACITEEGMKRIDPEFIPSQLNIYMDSTDNILSVKSLIEKNYSNIDVINLDETFDTMLESFNKAMIVLCSLCILITLGIISLILYLLIRIKLIKERMRIGVNKAIGYTTGQLIYQIIISFCPVCIVGTLAGTVLATFLINPTFAVLLSVSGIRNCELSIDPMLTLITFLAISLFSILITVLVALSVRKITPRELFM